MRSILAALVFCFVIVAAAAPADARLRTYYIAADEVLWNYAPSGTDVMTGRPLPPLQPLQLGWSFRKAVYDEYTDASFTHRKTRPSSDAYLGLIGPIIHAEVGDT